MWNNANKVQKGVDLCLESLTENFNINVSCSVVKQITTLLPQNKIKINTLYIPSNIVLSDKDFQVPGEVSLLLAANVFFKVIQDGKIEGGPLDLVLINTRLVYVVSGHFNPVTLVHTAITMHSISMSNVCIDELVKKFWETEQVPQCYNESLREHEISEEAFNNTVNLCNNRLEVSLPLKIDINTISPTNSFSLALQKFCNLEKRFKKGPLYFQMHKAFIQEYIKLGHAKVVDLQSADINTSPEYFLPHHAVVLNDKKTNKLRVVFDGSANAKGAEYSLNDILCNGCVVQKSHRVLQNILWRESTHEALQC
ncbi:unnamed protein product [Parnassius mnemosyne]|uniref:Uncharacterized protein n=1 Tax=Parnassius mnemosyne TaxID=213953 RepID=A0AAV1KQ58_9NEOP